MPEARPGPCRARCRYVLCVTLCLPRHAPDAALSLTRLCAGASAQGISTLTSDPAMMMGPAAMPPGMAMSPGTGAPPPAGVCSGDQVLTTPPAFSDFMTNSTTDAPMIFNGDCPAGSYVTGFIIIPAIAATGPADNRVYSIQAQCNDAEMTLTSQVNLTAPAAGKTCSANFTAGPVNSKVNFTSNSNPPAFWNVYYRYVRSLCKLHRGQCSQDGTERIPTGLIPTWMDFWALAASQEPQATPACLDAQ